MLSARSEAPKRWFSRKKPSISLKRFRSQPNLRALKGNKEEISSESVELERPVLKVLVEFTDSNQDEEPPLTSPISIVQLNVLIKDPVSEVEVPLGPPSPVRPPTTEDDFEQAINDALRYKDACSAAEDTAEEEARRRFKHYQDMYYLEKALQEKSAEAHKKLQKLFKCARQAGFTHLAPPSRRTADGRESRASHDSIDRFIDRVDNRKLSQAS
ncbi:hypothetical protein GALMADRAFT_208688 [Galerina marginata CBS 339.88]|uniref:Uncharacterized protein n=1 Tax=Galerina marginata (strain CBS 339.88) TaxID=685588 RepID=A0A067T7R0_GALM3|nr:hypothetical protein GALMADRAFT_208688 [Galerina marginata CBS 339.88]